MIRELPLGVYVPGSTIVHRASPTLKFLAIVVLIILVTWLPTRPWHTAAVLVGVLAFYALARIPLRTTWRQLAPILPFLAFLGAFMWWQNGFDRMLTVTIGLIASFLAATLLTLTTTIEALLTALEKNMAPLARIGVPVDTISLAIALTIRQIPVLLNTANESLAARKARGARFSLLAFGTPLVIRSIRRAEMTGEALMARGAVD